MWITRKNLVETKRLSDRLPFPNPAWIALALLLFVSLFPQTVSADPLEDLARQGDTAYRDGDYLNAIDCYSRILAAGMTSGPLLYNLGNAHYKAGHIADAILFYERAQRAMPHNRDVRYNLELAQSRTVDRIDAPPRLPVWDLLDWARDLAAPATVSVMAWLFALLAALGFGGMLLIRKEAWIRPLRAATITVTALFLVTLLFVGLRIGADHGDPGAIVMGQEVDVHSAPDRASLTTFTLHAGTKVVIIKELGDWCEVLLADGRQGWMPKAACEVI